MCERGHFLCKRPRFGRGRTLPCERFRNEQTPDGTLEDVGPHFDGSRVLRFGKKNAFCGAVLRADLLTALRQTTQTPLVHSDATHKFVSRSTSEKTRTEHRLLNVVCNGTKNSKTKSLFRLYRTKSDSQSVF